MVAMWVATMAARLEDSLDVHLVEMMADQWVLLKDKKLVALLAVQMVEH